MTKALSIRLYLVDGTTTGIIVADIPTWAGKAVVGPRTLIAELVSRREAKSCGIYILTGPDPYNTAKTLAYVGQANIIGKRLEIHNRDESKGGKDFWSRAYLMVYKDENLTEAHARYLESRFITIAK